MVISVRYHSIKHLNRTDLNLDNLLKIGWLVGAYYKFKLKKLIKPLKWLVILSKVKF